MKIAKTLKKLKFWQVLFLLIVSLPISSYFLRQNNLQMLELRDIVVEIDRESNGDLELIEPALGQLRKFVNTHMNTEFVSSTGEKLPHVNLQSRYIKVVDEIVDEKEKTDSAYRRSVYQKAQDKCTAVILSIRVSCIQEQVDSQPGVEPLVLPPADLFSYEFSSPLWSLDYAGASVFVSLTLGFFTLLILINDIVIPRLIDMVRKDPLE